MFFLLSGLLNGFFKFYVLGVLIVGLLIFGVFLLIVFFDVLCNLYVKFG